MAFRKSGRSGGKSGSRSGGKNSGGGRYRSKPAARAGAGSRASGGVHTVRVVIEQPGRALAAADAITTADVKARKSPF